MIDVKVANKEVTAPRKNVSPPTINLMDELRARSAPKAVAKKTLSRKTRPIKKRTGEGTRFAY